MSNIPIFVPKPSVQGDEAIERLVQHYKTFMQTPLENPLNKRQSPWIWGNFRWQGAGRFMKIEYTYEVGSGTRNLPPQMRLPEKTLETVQALILHYTLTGTKRSRSGAVSALRALLRIEAVLRKRSVNKQVSFADVTASDLEEASHLVLKDEKDSSPIRPGQRLLIQTGIATSGSMKNWVDSKRAAKDAEYKASLSLDSEGDEKLPSMQAVKVAAAYFAAQPWLTRTEDPQEFDEDQRNVIVASVLAVLALTPCRIEEVVKNLSVNSLVRQPESSVGEVLGINWYADKTDMSHTKWVPYTPSGEFEAVVEEAFARIKYLTDDARALLRTWDSECPEFDEAAYLKAKRENRLPRGWPYFEPNLKLRFSDTLFVCFKHQMHPINHTDKTRIDWITESNFKDWLRTRPGKNRHTGEPIILKGFFDRIGHSGLQLRPNDYNSHAFRHMVNTAARLGGMSEFDVNMWSHRTKAGQGEVYNHMSGEQRRNLIVHGSYKAKELTPEERLEHIKHNLPITRANLGMQFELIGNSYGGFAFNHPLGTCIHNYIEGPCMKSMDCVMCTENAHCKGDKRRLKNLQEELEESNRDLAMAIQYKDRRGERRFEKRSKTLIALVDILGDNSPLSDGDLVILSPDQVPKSGLYERAKLAADQIKKNLAGIESRHNETRAEIAVSRTLPKLGDKTSTNEDELAQDIDSVVDDFLSNLDDDDDDEG